VAHGVATAPCDTVPMKTDRRRTVIPSTAVVATTALIGAGQLVTSAEAGAEPGPSSQAQCENSKTRVWCDEPELAGGNWLRCYRKLVPIPGVGWKTTSWKCEMCGQGLPIPDGPEYHIGTRAKERTR
jgi:hypothetical protein